MLKMIKAVFFDVDGTLVSHTRGEVSASTRKAVRQLKEKGIQCIIATGRHMGELKKLPVKDIEFDAYITLNGQLCLDGQQAVLSSSALTGADKEQIIRLFEKKDIPILLVEKERMYINFVNKEVEKAQQDISSDMPETGEYAGGEIISRHGGKVAGIRQYLKENNILIQETMAFGDGENDIEMLEYAGIGIAMGNSDDMVKKSADYVTDCIDNEGIEKALRHFEVI